MCCCCSLPEWQDDRGLLRGAGSIAAAGAGALDVALVMGMERKEMRDIVRATETEESLIVETILLERSTGVRRATEGEEGTVGTTFPFPWTTEGATTKRGGEGEIPSAIKGISRHHTVTTTTNNSSNNNNREAGGEVGRGGGEGEKRTSAEIQ